MLGQGFHLLLPPCSLYSCHAAHPGSWLRSDGREQLQALGWGHSHMCTHTLKAVGRGKLRLKKVLFHGSCPSWGLKGNGQRSSGSCLGYPAMLIISSSPSSSSSSSSSFSWSCSSSFVFSCSSVIFSFPFQVSCRHARLGEKKI